MPYPAMPTQIKCSNCGKTFVAQIETVLDVGEAPEVKERFLRGRVNVAECPDCGAGGLLSSPLVYHDPEKELLITYVPTELELSADQREQLVGSLVQAVMHSVPETERKGYFLTPKSVLTLDGLYDLILEADGISKEMLEAQRQRMTLLSDLLQAVEDDETFVKLVEEHREELDYSFFLLISDLIEANQQAENGTEPLERMREKLLEHVNPAMPATAPADASYEDLITLLQEAREGDTLSASVALNRERLDYGFFQALTARIDTSDDEEAKAGLTALREEVLQALDEMQQQLQQMQDEANLLILELLGADDISTAVHEHMEEINDITLGLLGRLRAAAQSKGDSEREAKLAAVWDAIISELEERLPPDVRLINRLMRSEYPDGTGALLEENRGLLTDDLLTALDGYIEQLGESDADMADHLKQVRGQIVAKRTILH